MTSNGIMDKTIICFCGPSNIGKTDSIRRLWKRLNPEDATMLQQVNNDFCATTRYHDVLMGVASQGDPGSQQEEWIEHLVGLSCGIIICAARSRGYTVDIVADYAKRYGYRLLWFYPMHIASADEESMPSEQWHEFFNRSNADAVLQIIDNLLKP